MHSTSERQRALADAVGKAAATELAKSKPREPARHLAREWQETAARPPMMVNDLRPERDSNARPTA